jgi:PPK2 family polyphosphate:nucleotide phosphotransferase
MGLKRLDKPGKVSLKDFPTRETGGYAEEEARGRMRVLGEELMEAQELLYAAGENGLLVVLQGRDTAGKDGTLKAVGGAMNPVGIRVASFKVPTPLELAHDFLWRIHQQTPARGETVFFNRSQYEDVLVVRVHNLAPEAQWKERYGHINDFEELLAESGTIVVKFFLNISKDEQEERLRAREDAPQKAWKLNPGDWEERKYWDDYTRAYEDAIGKCASKNAPWYVVPADHKWYRNVAIAEALLEELKPYKEKWKRKLAAEGEAKKVALAKVRT